MSNVILKALFDEVLEENKKAALNGIKSPLNEDQKLRSLSSLEEHKKALENNEVSQVLFMTIRTDGKVQKSIIMTPFNLYAVSQHLSEMTKL